MQIAASPENAQAVADLVRRVADLWLAAAADDTAPKPETAEQRAALEHTDAMLLAYARRDPDNKVGTCEAIAIGIRSGNPVTR